jgi:hypothetical protein
MSSPLAYPFPITIQESLHVLGYPENTRPSSVKELNKRYHILALQHHPDKVTVNATSLEQTEQKDKDATEKFKEINEAHKRLLTYFYSDFESLDCDIDTGYDSILQLFIKTLLVKISSSSRTKPNTSDPNVIQSIIHQIITKGIQSAIKMFRSMDKQSMIVIYDTLSKNQELFGISRETMEELTNILDEKTSLDMVIRLNPSLLDMLLDRVYILNEDGHAYYIPLWHSELHFKRHTENSDAGTTTDTETSSSSSSSGEIIVLCDPEIPDNVSIDDDNNIYISLDVDVCELFTKQVIPVTINDEIESHGFIYYLHACDVKLQSSNVTRQRVLLHGTGIAKWMSGGDIYKIGSRANVYANVRLFLTNHY